MPGLAPPRFAKPREAPTCQAQHCPGAQCLASHRQQIQWRESNSLNLLSSLHLQSLSYLALQHHVSPRQAWQRTARLRLDLSRLANKYEGGTCTHPKHCASHLLPLPCPALHCRVQTHSAMHRLARPSPAPPFPAKLSQRAGIEPAIMHQPLIPLPRYAMPSRARPRDATTDRASHCFTCRCRFHLSMR
jgi:hypothetical protein